MASVSACSLPQHVENRPAISEKQEEVSKSPFEAPTDVNEENDENLPVIPATERAEDTPKHQQSRVLKTCFICNREFTRGTNLRRHLAIIHRLNPLSLLASSQHNDHSNEDHTAAISSNSSEKPESESDTNLTPVKENDDRSHNLSETRSEVTQPPTSDFDTLPSMALSNQSQHNDSPSSTAEEQHNGSGENPPTLDSGPTDSHSKPSLRLKLPKPIKMCPYCGKTFTRNTNLRRHLENDVCRGGLITWETKAYRHQFLNLGQKIDEDSRSKTLDSYLVTSPVASSKSKEIEDNESKVISMSQLPRSDPEPHIGPDDFTHQVSTQNCTTHGFWTVSDSMCSSVNMADSGSCPSSPVNEDIHTVIPSDCADSVVFDNDNDNEERDIYRTVPSSSVDTLLQHRLSHHVNGVDANPDFLNSWRFPTSIARHPTPDENLVDDNSMFSTEDEESAIPVVLPSDYIAPDYEENEDNPNQVSSEENAELTPDGVENLSMDEVNALQHIAGDNSHAGWKLLSCNICRKQYSDVQILLKHLMIHRSSEKESYLHAAQQKEIVTKLCGKESVDVNPGESDRRIPTLTISSTDMTMQINCGIPIDARRRPRLSRTCHICNKVFSRTTTLRRHMVVHQKTYKCNKCSRNLRKDKFLAHLAWCGQLVSPKSEDNNVVSTGSEEPISQSVSRENNGQDAELSSCEDTPGSNSNICIKGGCRRHKLTRTCHICHKVFSRTTTLRRHMTIHNRKSVQACHKCNSVFPEGLEFQEHIAQCLVDDATDDNETFYNSISALDMCDSNHDTKSSSSKESNESFADNNYNSAAGITMKVEKPPYHNLLTDMKPNRLSHDNNGYFASFPRDSAKDDEGCKDDHDPSSDKISESPGFMNKFWLSCNVCGKIFLRKETLKRHMVVHENQQQVYNCVTCGLNFYRQNEYADHAAHCYGKRLSSNIQNTYNNTNVHLDIETKNQSEYPSFTSMQKISNETRPTADSNSGVPKAEGPSVSTQPTNISNRGRPKMSRTCQICNKTFSRTTVLRIHMQLHQDRPVHKCERCNRSFHGKMKYESHLPLCSALSSTNGDAATKEALNDPSKDAAVDNLRLESNALKVETDNLDSADNGGELSSKKMCGRPKLTRTCHICHKTFSRTTVLRKHMAIHQNIPKYNCIECGVAFRKKTLYLIHMNSCKKVNREELGDVSGAFPPDNSVDGSGLSMVKEDYSSFTTNSVGTKTSTPTYKPNSEEIGYDMGGYSVDDVCLDDKEVRPFQDSTSEMDNSEVDVKPALPDGDSSVLRSTTASPHDIGKSKKGCGRPKMSRTCHICHKTFSRTTVLRKHMSVHEEKPLHECSACGAAFRRKNHLTAHTMKCIEAMQLQHERDALNDVRSMKAESFIKLVDAAPSPQRHNDALASYSPPYEVQENGFSRGNEVPESKDQRVQDYHSIHHPMPLPFPMEYLESIGGITMSMEQELKGQQLNNSVDYNSDSDGMYSLNSSNDLMRQLEHITSTRHRCYKCYACFDRAQDLDEHMLLCTDEVMAMSPPPYASMDNGPYKQSMDSNNASETKDQSENLKERRNPCRNVGC